MPKYVPRECIYCHDAFEATTSNINAGGGKYCSRKCVIKGSDGKRTSVYAMNEAKAKKALGLDVAKLNFAPTPAQQRVEDANTRNRVIEAGKQSGKTEYAIYRACQMAKKAEGYPVWYVAPTYGQARDIVWRRLLNVLPPEFIAKKLESRLTVKTVWESDIVLKGGDKEDSLRGSPLGGLVMEECAYLKEILYTAVLKGQLGFRRAPAMFISSPKGNNWFHKLYEYAKSGKDSDWSGFHFTIYDNPHISREEIDSIRRSVSEATWRQEYLAEVLNFVGQVYTELDEVKTVVVSDQFPNYMDTECVRGLDWGLDDETAAVWVHVIDRQTLFVSDEYSQGNLSIPQQAGIIKRIDSKRMILTHNSVLDISAFRRDPTSMRSVASVFGDNGIKCVESTKDSNLGIELLKRSFQGRDGVPWIYISHNCPKLIEAIRTWEHKEHEPDILAALRYAVSHIYKRKLVSVFGNDDIVSVYRGGHEDNEILTSDGKYRLPLRRPISRDIRWNYEVGRPDE